MSPGPSHIKPAPPTRSFFVRSWDFRGLQRFATILVLFSLLRLAVRAQQAHPTKSQVEAAYLYNFGKFVKWPGETDAAGTSFDICVLGKDPFRMILNSTVVGGNIDNKKVTAREISSLQESSHCRIVFISTSEQNRLKTIFATARAGGILTVSDIPHFADKGGMIEFVTQENRIRFAVNLPATEGAGLTLSSELLKVATKVIGQNGN